MDFFYENHRGTVRFKGGGSAKSGFYIKEITGLGLPEKEYNIAVYVNQPGREVISDRDIERIITLSVDAYSTKNVREEVRRMLEVLYQPGVLTLLSGTMHRKIACRCTGVEHLQRQGRQILSLILQFTCDCPYFTDYEEQKTTLFLRRDLISGSFVMPCVFTERTTRCTVVNQGDISAEPKLIILNTGAENAETVSEEYGITITNHTTGQQLTLNYSTEPGETVTVDIPGRSIISDINGNLIETLAQDSFLSNFYLSPGKNDIEVISYNSGKEITVSITYDNQYIEAVV